MKILVCGTRKKGYEQLVINELNILFGESEELSWNSIYGEGEIIEGCCPDSADEYAENWVIKRGLKIHHFPSHSGNYLKRNIEMVDLADEVIAFWDGFSYGTCHTIATAVLKNKPVKIIKI